ncbi:Crp/Fnr family transcriptional regulator [Neobacillus ginsengisoli]|uniref:CRP-like cAMP-binding protein n=1 Tax=Neobacillus ginsengisoli TaxID=904295 RepID=A0ABT9Y0T3_9BACI|nr:Crp/Fnr family transcriptional regulator [Neobacillus ginsengisoli]MDQ0201439.1 CRP-like cAMP-binding protein [Neobacillus ginsengisoli]
MVAILFDSDINWETCLQFGTRQFFKEKSCIYQQGSSGDGFYYIQKGLIKVTTTTTIGQERLLNIAIPGQLLGIQTMDRQPHFTTATAVSDSILYFFSCEHFQELIKFQPSILNMFIKTVIHKMHNLAEKIYLDTLSPEQQLSAILLNICYEFRNYEVPLTQQDLTKCTGLTRITIYKILKQWKEKQIIEIQGRKFLIKKTDELKKLLGRVII